MNKKISDKIITFLSISDETSAIKISYYLESILGEIEKFIMLLIIFTALGYGLEGCIAIGVMLVLRPYLGGTHFKSFWKCFAATLIITVVPVVASDHILPSYLFIIASVIVLLLLIFLAPVKSGFRIDYFGEVLVKIRLRGVFALTLLCIFYVISNGNIRSLMTYIMFELIIDFVIAACRNGVSSVKKKV